MSRKLFHLLSCKIYGQQPDGEGTTRSGVVRNGPDCCRYIPQFNIFGYTGTQFVGLFIRLVLGPISVSKNGVFVSTTISCEHFGEHFVLSVRPFVVVLCNAGVGT